MNKALKKVIERHKGIKGTSYLEVIAFDDLKKDKKIRQKFFDLSKTSIHEIQTEIEMYNTGSYGVYINVNPLRTPLRKKDTVKEYVYCFIDLDDAQEDHKDLVKTFLIENNFKYEYLGQSGSGYHFLIPINLPTSDQDKIKGFLNYLKNNVTDKTDITTNDPTRIYRVPESIHNKRQPSFNLKTLELETVSDDLIISNTENLLKFQEENKKAMKDIKYLSSIDRKDLFFSEILNKQDSWVEIFKMLNNHDKQNEGFGSNLIFNKNLAIFCSKNQDYLDKAYLFMQTWNNKYVTADRFKYFYKKVCSGELMKESSTKRDNLVNYYELLKWSNTYDFKIFAILLKQQLENSFLDEMEIYYLEDEKQEYQYLIYYSEKDYYLQKNLLGLIDIIYYEAKEKGLDLIQEWDIEDCDDKGNKLPHTTIIKRIRNTIITKLDKQNRIKKIYNINYAPTDEKFIYSEHKKFFNVYKKTAYWDIYKPLKKYHFPHIKELVMNLCGDEIKSYNYFNSWLGWQIQNPTEKLPTAIILQGRQGSGKGTFKTHILDNIFGSNVQEINQTHLESSFNEYLLGKQIIVANEVMHNENKQTLPNVLKNLVTDPTITISRKFRKEIEGKNYTHWFFCTNSDNPIRIDDDDRRYSVFYSEKLKGGGKAAAKFVKQLQINIDHELKEYVSYLKDLVVEFSDVHEPIKTAAKEDIIELNKDSVHKFHDYLLQFKSLAEVYQSIYKHLDDYARDDTFGDGNSYILTDNFYLLYEKWCEISKERGIYSKQNFSKKLSAFGCKSLPKWKDTRTFRMYNILDIEKLMVNKK